MSQTSGNATTDRLTGPIRPWSSLLIRDYRLIFIAILCGSTSNHMRSVASLYQVYQLSGSSVQLGLAGFFQALPSIVFGLFGGLLADTLNRKRLIAVTHTLNIIPGLALGIVTVTGTVQVWHVNALNILAGALQVLGGPARQAIVPSLIPPSHLLNAVTITTLLMQGAQFTAPVIAGAGAALIGAPNAALLGCVLCAVTVFGTCWAIPQLWTYRSD